MALSIWWNRKGTGRKHMIIDVQLDYHNNRVDSSCNVLSITMDVSTSSTGKQGISPHFLSSIYI
jgi:hypothetical protein